MDLDAQILIGAAVTVFLALLFFAVVVLWDLSLALRSLGDKLDKLEDTVDDDLTDINHTIDGSAGFGGGGGGTQLHLSGGTITSGPASSQQSGHPNQPGTPAAGAQGQQAGAGVHHQSPEADGVTATQHPQQGYAGRHPGDGQYAAGDDPRDASMEQHADDEDVAGKHDDEGQAETDDAVDDGSAPDEEDQGDIAAEQTDEDAETEHPRAAMNRGRFITSPDRTAWYATPLDWEAIRDDSPIISGELEPPVSSTEDEDVETEDDADATVIAVGPAGDTATVTETDSRDVESPSESKPDDEDGDAEEPDRDESTGTDQAGDAGETVDLEKEVDEDDADEESPAEDDESVDSEDDAEEESPAEDDESVDSEDDAEEESPAEDDDADEDGEAMTENEEVESGELDGSDTFADSGSDSADSARDQTLATQETVVVSFEDTESDPDTTDETGPTEEVPDDSSGQEADEAGEEGEKSADDGDDSGESTGESPPEGIEDIDIDFDEIGAEEEQVSVEDAVETVNENEPAFSLSSHRFDASADTEGDDAVLQFEFDPETVDVSGSTERLLRYQLQSYADRDSVPDGDISIESDRIVVRVPDADGNAISNWRDAVVTVVDRTLYLSDSGE